MRDRVELVMASIHQYSNPITRPAEFLIKKKWRVGLVIKTTHGLSGKIFPTVFTPREWKALVGKEIDAIYIGINIPENSSDFRYIDIQKPHLCEQFGAWIDRNQFKKPFSIKLSSTAFNQIIANFSYGLMLTVESEDRFHDPQLMLQDIPLSVNHSDDALFGDIQCVHGRYYIMPNWEIVDATPT